MDRQSGMTEAEIDEFLGDHESGVLALARRDEPYAIPISYGYDSTARQFYMRLVSTPDSEKRHFLTDSPESRFVVYGEHGGIYRSVVATGTLETISTDELDIEQIEQYGDAKRPLFEIWGESRADLDIDLYELDPDDLSGRRVDTG